MDEVREQKERLEQELRFLKESLEAEVISREEYEKGKDRIERKLGEIEKKEGIAEIEEPEKEKEGTREEEIEIREIKEEPEKIIIEKEEEELEEKEEEAEEVSAEETKEAIKEETEEIVISKKWIYGVAILVVVILFFFALRSCSKENQAVEETTPKLEEVKEAAAACTSDSDCKQEGKVGVCLNPNTKEAKCEFKEETGKKDAETGLIVINDEDCKLCDSSRMTNIIQEIFPNVKITGINYKTAEAKNIINQLGIDALPAYVFDSNLNSTMNFNDFKNALIKKGNKYLVTNTASGASYYFKRPLMKNKLDLYVIPETSEKIDAYTQEVVNLFADKIDFTRHIVTEGQKDELKKELGINTYPAFLVNNQMKFGGVIPANTIREKFCLVNYFEECKKELSKDIREN